LVAAYRGRVTRLVVVRHAQSEWNAEGRWQGRADPPLSATGEDQARRAGVALAAGVAEGSLPGPVVAIWSSDLQRSRGTAELLGAAAGWRGEVRVVPDLGEHDVGEWSGLTHDQIERRWPGLIEAWGAGCLAATPGGEARADFDRRVRRGLAAVMDEVRALGLPEGTGAVVTHGGVLRAIARWLGRPERAPSQLEGFVLVVGPDPVPVFEGALSLLDGVEHPDVRLARE
jgi:broad specificity phosphatase PhoE